VENKNDEFSSKNYLFPQETFTIKKIAELPLMPDYVKTDFEGFYYRSSADSASIHFEKDYNPPDWM